MEFRADFLSATNLFCDYETAGEIYIRPNSYVMVGNYTITFTLSVSGWVHTWTSSIEIAQHLSFADSPGDWFCLCIANGDDDVTKVCKENY